jgi:nucleoside-diphosphate-sugar epimerase
VKVLIVGARGFIGSHLDAAFTAAGHEVWGAGRAAAPDAGAASGRWITLDYTRPRPPDWARMLSGFHLVINAVGILRERGRQTFQALHVAGPQALFTAAHSAGVPRIIQVSALGADAAAIAPYHTSKHAADRFLLELPVEGFVVQPSLVYGEGGTSARLFESMASLPVIPLPGDGLQRVQPVHIDDLVAAVLLLAQKPGADDAADITLPVVGPDPLTMREFLIVLRAAMGLGRALVLPVPRALVVSGARLGDMLPGVLLDSDTLGMLERGNTASSLPLQRLLGRPPRAPGSFISPAGREAHVLRAKLDWVTPLLRAGVAAMWLIAGIVSLGLYPVSASLALLERIGVPTTLAPVMLAGAALLDIALGLLSLWPRAPRWLWSAQIALVLVYTGLISWRLPELWLEPFGPVAKNLPILALLILLQQLSRVRK